MEVLDLYPVRYIRQMGPPSPATLRVTSPATSHITAATVRHVMNCMMVNLN